LGALVGVAGGDAKRRDRHASVAARCVGDEFQPRLFDRVVD
jgi:hypothetical protein